MKKAMFILAGVILTGLALEGCKKGEGDPFLSLKSRKGRMAGEWKLSTGTSTHATVSGSSNISTTINFDGTNATSTTTINGTAGTPSTNGYTMELRIEKDGTFEMKTVTIASSVTTTEVTVGKWNFLNGIGEFKNKEAASFFSESVTTTSGTTTSVTTYTGEDRPTTVYKIYQLKNKEMILKHDYTDNDGSTSITHTEEWTLTQ